MPRTEYLGTLLMGLAGVMLVGSARDLVLLFLGLELLSIPTYVLLYLGPATTRLRRNRRSSISS